MCKTRGEMIAVSKDNLSLDHGGADAIWAERIGKVQEPRLRKAVYGGALGFPRIFVEG